MNGLLEGAVAVVTGGASGIGRAVCQRFAAEGAAAIVVADLRDDPREGGPTTADLIRAQHDTEVVHESVDVRSAEDIGRAVATADRFGGVSVLVNAAGVYTPESFLDCTDEDIDLILGVNVTGTALAMQAAARSMIARQASGAIVNLSSLAALRGSPANPIYAASKSAVASLTASLAAVLGPHGIRVNAILPGVIETAMTMSGVTLPADLSPERVPLQRHGRPSDVADAAVYLAGPMAAYVTGANLVVDGGLRVAR